MESRLSATPKFLLMNGPRTSRTTAAMPNLEPRFSARFSTAAADISLSLQRVFQLAEECRGTGAREIICSDAAARDCHQECH